MFTLSHVTICLLIIANNSLRSSMYARVGEVSVSGQVNECESIINCFVLHFSLTFKLNFDYSNSYIYIYI